MPPLARQQGRKDLGFKVGVHLLKITSIAIALAILRASARSGLHEYITNYGPPIIFDENDYLRLKNIPMRSLPFVSFF